ncbi:MAG: Ig-like domain-containing protein, partial [Fibrobacteria bacterium]
MRILRLSWLALMLTLAATGCNLSEEETVQNTISFDRIADSLKQYDVVVIVLKDQTGKPIDTVYNGKVNQAADVHKLKAPHWNGGKVIVAIFATKSGKLAYQAETNLDPASSTRDINVILSPYSSLTSAVQSLPLIVGDSVKSPAINVSPGSIIDKQLDWSVSPPELLAFGPDFLKALQAGSGTITIRLRSNPDITLSIPVVISASGMVPVSIGIKPESLTVAADGPPGSLTAQVLPSGASSAVTWLSADSTIASVNAEGRVQGKRQGETTVSATSQVRSNITNSVPVRVTGPVPVEKIDFSTESLEIAMNGAAVELVTSVTPPTANPAVVFTLSEPGKATIQNGKISGIQIGNVSVFAASVANPDAKDTLFVNIKATAPDDTVPPLKPIVHVKPAGPTQNLRPVWSWSSGGGSGAGSFQVSLDKATFDSAAALSSDTTFTPPANLGTGSHVLYVRERDAAGNWSLPGSAQVDIDTTAPSAPKIYGASPTSALPRWSWSSGGSGGAGVYRSRLVDAVFPANAPESPDMAYALTAAVTGTTYTLFVEERDSAGNWSAAASLPIKYDLTKPTVTITLPQASGTFITSADTVTVSGT